MYWTNHHHHPALASRMFSEVAAGEDRNLVKARRPEDKRRRVYHAPEHRIAHPEYRRDKPAADGGFMKNIEKGIDQTIDKYDYLIIFPNTPPPPKDSPNKQSLTERFLAAMGLDDAAKAKAKSDAMQRISFSEAVKQWKHAAVGGDANKAKAAERFKNMWMEKFRGGEPHPTDTVPMESYRVLVRELVLSILSGDSGLQLKLSQSKSADSIYCRIRAPLEVLERQADGIDYPLKFRAEIDPGSWFWTDEECREDSREGEYVDRRGNKLGFFLRTREDAEQAFQRLYEAGKLSPHDIEVFDEETKPLWFARVKALERVADRVPVDNPFPAFFPFSQKKHLRYVYEQYESTRGPTLFLSKDRLFLIRSIMLKFIDLDILADYGILKGVLALHDSNRGEYDSVERLASNWCFSLTSRFKSDIGGVTIDSPYADQSDETPPPYLWLFCQPLNDIRNYFGEEVAFYFAWVGYLSFMFLIPTVLGIANELYFIIAGSDWCKAGFQGGTYFQVLTAVATICWAVYYKETWLGQQKLLALKWGTRGVESTEKNRPQFRGTEYARDPVTLREELHYPSGLRVTSQLWSYLLILGLVALLAVEIDALEYLEHDLVESGYSWGTYVVNTIFAVQIPLLSALYGPIAQALNENENHQTETAFVDSLVFKTFLFQFVNLFGPLLYQAFVKEHTYGCINDCCMEQTEELLEFIMGVRFLLTIYEVIQPALSIWVKEMSESDSQRQIESLKSAEEGQLDSESLVANMEPFEKEVLLIHYPGTFHSFSAVVFMFGLVTAFVTAFPAAPAIAMLFTLVTQKTDAYKLCRIFRRPNPIQVEDVGLWLDGMNFMAYFAILANSGVVIFTSNTFEEYSYLTCYIIFLVTVQALIIIKFAIEILVPDEPEFFKSLLQRHEYLVEKHIHGDSSAADDDSGSGAAGKRGNIDVADLDTPDAREESKAAEDPSATPELKKLELDIASVQRDLLIRKDKLKTALKTEVFNEKTGIGETLHGLPLGCVSLKLITMEGVPCSAPKNTSVVVSLKSTRPNDSTAPGPPAQVSKPGRTSSHKKDAIDFNQTFTLAPVKSHEAQLVFDIMDQAADPKRRGTCKLHLRDLASQLEANMTLNVLVREQGPEGAFVPETSARLFIRAKFQYSKVRPLRHEIYELQNKERELRKRKTELRLSKAKE